MAPYVDREISKYEHELIFEAAFLEPRRIEAIGSLVLDTVTSDEEKHRRQYFEHRTKSDENEEQFQAGRILQNYLLAEARGFAVTIVENEGEMGEIVKKIAGN